MLRAGLVFLSGLWAWRIQAGRCAAGCVCGRWGVCVPWAVACGACVLRVARVCCPLLAGMHAGVRRGVCVVLRGASLAVRIACGRGAGRACAVLRVPSLAGLLCWVFRVRCCAVCWCCAVGLCCVCRATILQRGHGVALVIMRVCN